MTSLSPHKNATRPTVKKSLTVQSRRFYRAAYTCFAIAGVGLVTLGCVASQTAPPETSFSAPVQITLPTTQIADALDATGKADRASTETIRVVDSINASNVTVTQPEAARWARATHDAIQEIYAPLHSAKSINDVAADRVIEATNQTNDARQRLKESEMTRAVERAAAKRQIDAANKRADNSESWLYRVVGGFATMLGVCLMVFGTYAFFTAKTRVNGSAAVAAGVVSLIIGMAVWKAGWLLALCGVGFIAPIATFIAIWQVRRQREQTKQIAVGVESLKQAGKLDLNDVAVAGLLDAPQSKDTKALVDTVTNKMKAAA